MAQALTRPGPDPTADQSSHSLNRLDVYVAALEFQRVADRFLSECRSRALRDQLDRASVSIVLNIAEGAGRFGPADKARFYVIARASALECQASLDMMAFRGIGSAAELRSAAGLLDRIVAMLTRLAGNAHQRARTRD